MGVEQFTPSEPAPTALELDSLAREHRGGIAAFLSHVDETTAQIFVAAGVGDVDHCRDLARWLRDDALGVEHVEDLRETLALTEAQRAEALAGREDEPERGRS